jgi:hypothetical protein
MARCSATTKQVVTENGNAAGMPTAFLIASGLLQQLARALLPVPSASTDWLRIRKRGHFRTLHWFVRLRVQTFALKQWRFYKLKPGVFHDASCILFA